MEDFEPEQRPPTRRETLVPVLSVAAVAIVAVTAAVMVKRADDPAQEQLATREPAGPVAGADVVKAPPLKSPETRSMGGAPACDSCGIVQMVVAVNEPGRSQPRGYQMHIRMDNGSVRTIVQRGALAAGSRVVVEGDTVRPMS